MAHPEIVGMDEQQAGIGGVTQEVIRWAGIPCGHLATPSRKDWSMINGIEVLEKLPRNLPC